MKLQIFKIKDIAIDLLISESADEIKDPELAKIIANSYETHFGLGFCMNPENLN